MLIEPFILAAAAALTASVGYSASMFAARWRKFLDHPNNRSSHSAAIPRSGGLAIFGAWCAGLFVLAAFSGDIPSAVRAGLISLCGGGALLIGLTDDRLGLAPVWKFAGQIVVAALFIALFGPLTAAPLPFFGDVTLGPVWGVAVSILWIVAFMNAFNFMDGANGLAAGAAAVGLAWVSVIASYTGAPFLASAALLLALAAAGFLPENLKRGRLFMGDNGSQAIGFLIAAFAVLGVNWTGGRMNALIVPVIFMPLIFDVAWTLASRLIRRQNLLEAHREHLYQLMMRLGASHASVAVIYMALTCFSAAAAILMLTTPAALHGLFPLMLALIYAAGAISISRRAHRAGLFENVAAPVVDADTALGVAE